MIFTRSEKCYTFGVKKFFLILLPVFLFSCASARFESDFAPVYVTNSAKYAILSPSEMDGNMDAVQRMTASFGENEFECDVYVISDSEKLSMTILNEFGATLAELFYDGATLDFDSAVFPKNLNAEYIVADFQFCLYRADSVKAALEKIGVDFEISIACGENETTETRVLSKNGKVISKITKKYGTSSENAENLLQYMKIENFLRGYSYILAEAGE